MFIQGVRQHKVPILVLETKHQHTLNLKTAAQAIGYYSRAKQGQNCYERRCYIEFRIILFPYCDEKFNFGAQAILLPTMVYSHEEFILSGDVIRLICTICGVLALESKSSYLSAPPPFNW